MASITSSNRDAAVRMGAPVRYEDVRASFNTARAIGGIAVAATCAVAAAWGATAALCGVLGGVAIVADGLYQRARGTSPRPILLVDVSVMGILLLIVGRSPGVEIAVLAYSVGVALLLLAMTQAGLLLSYTVLWAVPIIIFSPLASGPTLESTQQLVVEGALAMIFVALLGFLLLSAGRSLHAAVERQRSALITERRAGQLKNEFVSMVSHELRTPLTSIAGFTDTLRESWVSFGPAEIDEFLLIMRRETEHLRDLVEDILVIPRLEAGHLKLESKELDLRQSVFDSGEAVFTEAGTEFVVTIPGGVTVMADRVRLSQVLRNLLENARKYGGDQVLVDGDLNGELFRVMISDNGPGVPEEDIERIFHHFEQLTKGDARAGPGVGLGLPIARKLVTAMGGHLWYEPRFPIGARFCFTLPLAHMTRDPEEHPTPSAVA